MNIEYTPPGDGPLPSREIQSQYGIWTVDPEGDPSVEEQLKVFLQALSVYAERNRRYNDNWRRMGWRGMLVRIRERAERLWDNLWDVPGPIPKRELDDALDMINFAAFLIRAAAGETTRGGEWWD